MVVRAAGTRSENVAEYRFASSSRAEKSLALGDPARLGFKRRPTLPPRTQLRHRRTGRGLARSARSYSTAAIRELRVRDAVTSPSARRECEASLHAMRASLVAELHIQRRPAHSASPSPAITVRRRPTLDRRARSRPARRLARGLTSCRRRSGGSRRAERRRACRARRARARAREDRCAHAPARAHPNPSQ